MRSLQKRLDCFQPCTTSQIKDTRREYLFFLELGTFNKFYYKGPTGATRSRVVNSIRALGGVRDVCPAELKIALQKMTYMR